MAANKYGRSGCCMKSIFIIWVICMVQLLGNMADLEYLAKNEGGYFVEYAYFSFYSILAWHHFQINNLLGIYETPSLFWNKLEQQFIRLEIGNEQQPINSSHDVQNTYFTHKSSASNALLKPIEFDATSSNFQYSYSNLYELSNQYTKPVIFRNFIPATFDRLNLLNYMLSEYGDHKVPVMTNQNKSSLRFMHKTMSHDFNQIDGHKLNQIFDNTTYDIVKFWHLCDKHNNQKLWKYLNLDSLQIPSSDLAAAGLFMSNLPSKPANSSDINHWYLSSDIHSDVGPSFFIQIKGRKLWRLVDLKYSHLMRPIWYKTYGRSHAYNVSHFDLIPRYETILNEGDVIFFPQWIWHEAFIDHTAGFEVSCGIKLFRESNLLSNFKKSSMFTLNTLMSVAREALFERRRSRLC